MPEQQETVDMMPLDDLIPSFIGVPLLMAGIAIVVVGVIIGVVLAVIMRRTSSVTSGMVTGLVGRPGTGKTYAAIKMALERLQLGVDVISNFHIDTEGLNIKGTWRPFVGWEDLANARDCVVIIDEAHLYASSHQHVNFPFVARWALSQCRHNGLDVYWISQHEDRVNKSLRAITGRIGVCENWFGGKYFRVTFYEPEQLRKKKKELYKESYKFDLSIAKRYDTRATIDVDEYSMHGDKSAAALRRAIESQRARHEGATGAVPARDEPAGAPAPTTSKPPQPWGFR